MLTIQEIATGARDYHLSHFLQHFYFAISLSINHGQGSDLAQQKHIQGKILQTHHQIVMPFIK